MRTIELLAPAKDLECGIAAFNCGADAVYIGANKFGARASAGNELEDIEKLIKFAHKYWAKVYVTINTILNDREIEEAEKLINKLYEIGTDAIIIQDMGLLELDLPPIPLFASTQANNISAEKVKFLEKVGFKRAILARELSLEEIRNIKSNTDIELESFIHGALCVSYSGQCYLSYAIGGRSANRGECAQPCRKLYSLKDSSGKIIGKDKYLLSLKDLDLSGHIKDLLDSGITSFKIEGRLKDINYVKNIVGFYRQKIDSILENTNLHKTSSGRIILDFQPNPYKTFNRGYTDYFLLNRKKEIATINTPKSIGEPIGKVIDIDKSSFLLDNSEILNNGDGICFFDSENNLQGTVVNKVSNRRIFPNDIKLIKKNTFVYRNLDHNFLKSLNTAKTERKISVKITFSENKNELFLNAMDEDGIEACQQIKIEKELANNKDMALNNIRKQLSKLGDTEFNASEIEINLDNTYFIPVSVLNELRRNLIEDLKNNRQAKYPKQTSKITKNDYPYPDKNLDFSSNTFNKQAYNFYKRHGAELIQLAAESGIKMSGKKVMTTKHCLKYQFNLCNKSGSSAKLKEPLILVDSLDKEYKLTFDCKKCEMQIFF